MSQRTKGLIIAAITLVQVLGFAALLTRAIVRGAEQGSTGLVYRNDLELTEADQKVLSRFSRFIQSSSAVAGVLPGSSAAKAGIRTGDVVVSVGGIPAGDTAGTTALETRTRRGDELPVVVKRNGKARSFTVEMGMPLASVELLIGTATSILLAVTFLAISILVFWAKPKSRKSLVFYLMCATGSAFFFLYALFELEFSSLPGIAPMATTPIYVAVFVGYYFLALLLTNLILHLALIFPRDRPIVATWPEVFLWVHTLPFSLPLAIVAFFAAAVAYKEPWVGVVTFALVSGCLSVIAVLLYRRSAEGGLLAALRRSPAVVQAGIVVGATMFAPLLVSATRSSAFVWGILAGLALVLIPIAIMLGYSILTCVLMWRSYRDAGVEEKRQLRWPLWGVINAVAITTLLSAVYFVGAAMNPFFFAEHSIFSAIIGALLKLAYLFIPVSFAFGIVKYRLMDIDVIIRKTVVYGGVTGFVVLVYFFVVGLVGVALVSSAGITNQAVTVAATVFVAAALVPVRNRIQRFVNRRWQGRRDDLATAARVIGEKVLAARELREALTAIAELMQQSLQLRTVVVFVRDPVDGTFRVEAKVGLPDERAGRLALGADSSASALEGEVVDLSVAPIDAEDAAVFRRAGAVKFAPARSRRETVAMLAVGSRLDGEPFEDEDDRFIAEAANQIGNAVARLGRRRQDVELEQAREIQRALLPTTMPAMNGLRVAAVWRPAREVSGDYYDVLQLSPSRLAFCIADVVGKGMPAAMLMSSLQAVVKAIAPLKSLPDDLVRDVRNVIAPTLAGGKFITFFFGLVDTERRVLQYCNAGHNPPMLARRSGELVRLEQGGPAIARILAHGDPSLGEIALEAGDRVVLFTDGVTEAATPDDEQFGEERLVELIRAGSALDAGAMLASIVVAVERFSDGEFADDLTLLAIDVA